MSEARGNRELAGLARSVDQLFAVARTPSEEEAEPRTVTDVPWPQPSEVTGPPTGEVEPSPTLGGEPSPPDMTEPSASDVPEPEPVGDPGPGSTDARSSPSTHAPEPAAFGALQPPDADLRPVPPVGVEPPAMHGDVPLGEAATTALDVAVDAYLAGDRDRAGEIERLADEMLENREMEPIARSVSRLALAAGDPPDLSVLDVARSLMSPVVLARLASSGGAERDEKRREEHRQLCRTIGDDMARAIRNDLADSTDRLARRNHCETLVEMGEPGRRIIEEMAQDENRFLVRNAVAILGEVGGDRAVELVTSALANPDARVRREALRSLAKLGDEQAGPLVVGMLEDSDSDVRLAAAVAAGELHVERALRPLVAMLDACSDPDECLPILRALGQIGDPGAVNSIERHAVRSFFSKPRADVRIAAYRALSQIGTPHARRLLNQAVRDKDPEVKASVEELLNMR